MAENLWWDVDKEVLLTGTREVPLEEIYQEYMKTYIDYRQRGYDRKESEDAAVKEIVSVDYWER